jgi:hypothetical protein
LPIFFRSCFFFIRWHLVWTNGACTTPAFSPFSFLSSLGPLMFLSVGGFLVSCLKGDWRHYFF